MSVYRLEKLSGISHSTMSCLLSNKTKNTNFRTLFKIIYALEITPKEFFRSNLFDEENITLDWGLNMKINNAIGQRIQELAKQKNLTMYALQYKAGVSPSAFYNIIYNKNNAGNVKAALTIIYALDITPEEFFDSPLFDKENIEID